MTLKLNFLNQTFTIKHDIDDRYTISLNDFIIDYFYTAEHDTKSVIEIATKQLKYDFENLQNKIFKY